MTARLSLAFLALAVFTLTLTTLFVTTAVREEFLATSEANLRRHAETIATLMGRSMDEVALTRQNRRRLVDEMVRLSEGFQGRMCIVNWKGEVLEDSDAEGEKQVIQYLEVYEALNGRYLYQVRDNTLYLAVPIMAKGRVQGAVYASRPLDELDALMAGIYQRLKLAGLAVLGLSAALSLLLGRSISGPVKRLSEGVRRISQGDYRYRLNLVRRDELGGLASDVDHMAESLDSHREILMQFVSDASHELKTPVASVKALTEALQDGALDQPERARRFVELLAKETERMQQLVESLLSLQRLDGEPVLKLEVFDLKGLVESLVTPLALHQEVSCGGEPLLVRADRQAVSQVLHNLISNGVQAGEPVEISWQAREGAVEVRIADHGPGLTEEELEKVFLRFYRTEKSRSRVSGGSGLGLSICKRLIEAHGQNIWLENRDDSGLVACFRLESGE